ncbi:MAG TPA: hypothetical protein DCS93_03260 [Microscillaceae bacterium]|nr:hypothetical protein [Microscillaceae bacterium]
MDKKPNKIIEEPSPGGSSLTRFKQLHYTLRSCHMLSFVFIGKEQSMSFSFSYKVLLGNKTRHSLSLGLVHTLHQTKKEQALKCGIISELVKTRF